ncbi:CHASE2 domain-containing protein [Leptolyngbya cf. ectocarpi LEGE 11479]|uniref:CHASE2 domain-containing protein n=1 Tax=Leptolyngbya cf. ectocarpi LEGE 11479 TaxID=1828722 RepID=A0A928ZUY9_LEPEC|nr:CHASE2 domain-containing protein [Leptolyngbya ectocarpi]MBE9067931.1 CHASE2 domain-containing protein [Leptolyngbya cf. ectocarpi LEGE 11479]
MISSPRYQSGGSLPLDSPSYVTRRADEDLFQALLAGTYCYVLNARQMGKSSLRVRTVKRLLDAGVCCVEIELLGIGSQQVTATQWYGGMIQLLNSRLGLKVNRRQWLQEHEDLSPVQRFGTFIDQMVVPKLQQPLVIFFDEIDSVLGLNFPTEDFFGLIRNFYEQRASNPLYRQLTVVMLGVATPSDLMTNLTSTPFNIGRAISLQGFTLQEAEPLQAGLAPVVTDAEAGLAAILSWTGGQPFLTQKLCQLVVNHGAEITGTPQQRVDHIVHQYILNHWEVQDEPEHLRTIRNRMLLGAKAPERLLQLYQKILKQNGIRFNNRSSAQIELRFSGLVTQQQGRLQVFNRIYKTVFDQAWVLQQLQGAPGTSPKTAQRPAQQPALAYLWSGGITATVIVMQVLGWLQPIELRVFDQFLRWRPPEPRDDRFLVITVGEADIQYQDRLGYPRTGALSDTALLNVLHKIESHQPRVVGVDFFHEAPYEPELADRWSDRIIAICEKARTVDVRVPTSIAAPPDIDIDQVGFADFAIDPDYVVRRHLIGMEGSEACPTPAAFSLRLALRYLQPEGTELTFDGDQRAYLGALSLPALTSTSGGYQMSASDFKGYQLLVNYRHHHPEEVSLQQLLSDELDNQLETLIPNRIILLGLADAKDSHFIPGQKQRLPGVVVHAHMTSQLLSAVLDQRPLLKWWPNWLEIVGIGAVFLMSGWGVWWCRRGYPPMLWIAGGNLIIFFSGYGMLILSIWVPIVPAMLIWTGSTLCLTLCYPSWHRK